MTRLWTGSFVLKDIPEHVWPMWVMALPGMAFGGYFAPEVNERIGSDVLEAVMVVVLLLTALLFM